MSPSIMTVEMVLGARGGRTNVHFFRRTKSVETLTKVPIRRDAGLGQAIIWHINIQFVGRSSIAVFDQSEALHNNNN
jgi:hypothetical protein